MLSSVVRAAESTAEHAPSVPAWVIGGGALAILLLAIAVLIVFGAGREHS